ncbi:LysE family transporter [Mesorhizobium abyssinicae]|uniref:LysE family translocator n=1 Tax=Mesorhizobium abyssinicae TaxID=1209958 RepID=UPI002A24311E|nr:LysE family transporter [Mesorhizobium abyssinicae]MDX8437696.1 LysE family transporter [Mesorhizobium abyssinicae]
MTAGAGAFQLPLIAVGVASLLRASPFAFSLLQCGEAAYLVWLGLRMISTSADPLTKLEMAPLKPVEAVQEGMIANLMNPWPMTFMLAFLPQFVDPPGGSVTIQMLLLGATQKATGVLV